MVHALSLRPGNAARPTRAQLRRANHQLAHAVQHRGVTTPTAVHGRRARADPLVQMYRCSASFQTASAPFGKAGPAVGCRRPGRSVLRRARRWPEPGAAHMARRPVTSGLVTRRRQIADVHPKCGRELCAMARVNISGNRERQPVVRPQLSRAGVTRPPADGSGSCKRAACVDRPEIRRSARRSKHQALCSGRSSPRPRDCAACRRGYRVPAFQRRSLWLDRASARRALAVPPRGSTAASTSAAMSSRCSPGPSVRSRRLPGAAA
jgi:hypothetical protein